MGTSLQRTQTHTGLTPLEVNQQDQEDIKIQDSRLEEILDIPDTLTANQDTQDIHLLEATQAGKAMARLATLMKMEATRATHLAGATKAQFSYYKYKLPRPNRPQVETIFRILLEIIQCYLLPYHTPYSTNCTWHAQDVQK